MMGEKGDEIEKETILLQIELRFYQYGDKIPTNELTKPKTIIVLLSDIKQVLPIPTG